jgi:hypothetical protein
MVITRPTRSTRTHTRVHCGAHSSTACEYSHTATSSRNHVAKARVIEDLLCKNISDISVRISTSLSIALCSRRFDRVIDLGRHSRVETRAMQNYLRAPSCISLFSALVYRNFMQGTSRIASDCSLSRLIVIARLNTVISNYVLSQEGENATLSVSSSPCRSIYRIGLPYD